MSHKKYNYLVGLPNNPNLPKFQERLDKIMERNWLTNNGPMVQQLEAAICENLGVNHCIAVTNATLGLETILKVIDHNWIDIYTSSFTFVATASCIRNIYKNVKFVDIKNSFGHWNDRHAIRNLKIVPQLFGSKQNPNGFSHSCIFDSAHGLGVKGLGGNGIAEVFSLHATKLVHGFEGGLITTNSSLLADRCREVCNFGYKNTSDFYKPVVRVGTNAKMSEVHAAMALTNFECLDQLITHNMNNWFDYQEQLPFEVQLENPGAGSNYSYILCRSTKRDKIIEHLEEVGIGAKIYFKPIHLYAPYANGITLPNTEQIAEEVFCLPTGLAIKQPDVKIICNEIKKALIS